jgi:hypothetical protein
MLKCECCGTSLTAWIQREVIPMDDDGLWEIDILCLGCAKIRYGHIKESRWTKIINGLDYTDKSGAEFCLNYCV